MHTLLSSGSTHLAQYNSTQQKSQNRNQNPTKKKKQKLAGALPRHTGVGQPVSEECLRRPGFTWRCASTQPTCMYTCACST